MDAAAVDLIPREEPSELQLSLTDAQLEQLGLALPKAGTEWLIKAKAVVTAATSLDVDGDGHIDGHVVTLRISLFTATDGSAEAPASKHLQSRAAAGLYPKRRPDVWVKLGERDVGGSAHVGQYGVLNRESGA